MNTYSPKENIVCRCVHDSFFLINITDNYLDDKCRLFEINEMGHIIWCGLSKYKADQIDSIVSEITAMLQDDIDPRIIYDDVYEYVLVLKENGFIEEV